MFSGNQIFYYKESQEQDKEYNILSYHTCGLMQYTPAPCAETINCLTEQKSYN